MVRYISVLFIAVLCAAPAVLAADKPKKKKDPRDYTDADIERIYREWEEQDEPLEEDELPEYMRTPKPIDFSNLDMNDPEALLAASKQGKPLMMFVTVCCSPSEKEVDELTGLWQTSLYNNHMDVQRYSIEANRVIFHFPKGEQAFEAVKWLTQQEKCEQVLLESKTYYGKNFKHLETAKKEL